MKFRVSQRLPLVGHHTRNNHLYQQRLCFTSFLRKVQTTQPRASPNGGGSSNSKGNSFLVPGATAVTIVMLGALHARRLYDDKKLEEARDKGADLEFQPDVKATFLRLLPLRSISRFWGSLTSVELPIWFRPHVYRAWARAFHSNLEEAAKPLEEYASLREFFVRTLKEDCRPIDSDPCCLISPVDGTVLRFGKLEAGMMIEQVKGFSYSLSSLLGTSSFLPVKAEEDVQQESIGQEKTPRDGNKNSWWRIALASPKVRDTMSTCPMKGLFYCVLYLHPGDYHRIHSPVDWNVLARRHFSGRLFPVNERATRTIRNLYVENERVVLEGRWKEGFMAMAAIGATNIGSIELFLEPALRTNRPKKKLLHSQPPEERIYEPEGVGVMLKKGDEMAAFNMGSTVVLVFQAPIPKLAGEKSASSEFKFCVGRGDRIRVGEPLGRWHDS
ncbi:Phosphatidylserine decarboxylase 1 alpha chain like [Actinidia chinensis var. chinensis]|uniref:Phosphatidylserine decarboxylase proenzyme 1, mitochondrial n=1 Tax=Actinidia chinensis var. chinensis TaxID=1590841 RepID=A0A2R6QNR4_ACTCC|nr:Phosphatidylserine decarboxylase 1 alpha chain like [Actinidia chinensis var. chinensis]